MPSCIQCLPQRLSGSSNDQDRRSLSSLSSQPSIRSSCSTISWDVTRYGLQTKMLLAAHPSRLFWIIFREKESLSLQAIFSEDTAAYLFCPATLAVCPSIRFKRIAPRRYRGGNEAQRNAKCRYGRSRNPLRRALRLNQQNRFPITILKDGKLWLRIAPLSPAGSIPTDTRQAMDEVDAIEASPNHRTYQIAEALFPELGI